MMESIGERAVLPEMAGRLLDADRDRLPSTEANGWITGACAPGVSGLAATNSAAWIEDRPAQDVRSRAVRELTVLGMPARIPV